MKREPAYPIEFLVTNSLAPAKALAAARFKDLESRFEYKNVFPDIDRAYKSPKLNELKYECP